MVQMRWHGVHHVNCVQCDATLVDVTILLVLCGRGMFAMLSHAKGLGTVVRAHADFVQCT